MVQNIQTGLDMNLKYDKVTKDQCKDTGYAIVLLLVIFTLLYNNISLLYPVLLTTIICMTYPLFIKPLAYIWINFSYALGDFLSKILLSIVFFIIVTPISIGRRVLGKDSMQLKRWKKGDMSVFTERFHTYERKDIEKPY